MRILAIDTSASPVSAALTDNDELLGEFYLNIRTTHSQTLMPVIEALLKSAGMSVKDIDVAAVNAGPGSFTGVRIGIATVKGLTMSLGIPCAQVSTLEAMAYQLPYSEGIACAVMDARCSQVYNALFRLNGEKPERITEDRAISIDELFNELKDIKDDTVFLVGDGAVLCHDSFSGRLDNIKLVPQNLRFQHAYGTARAARELADNNGLCSSDELMPVYLRLPQAERERIARMKTEKH